MKSPRGVSADQLIYALERLGYAVVRPRNPVKTATLHGILSEVAPMRPVSIESIAVSF